MSRVKHGFLLFFPFQPPYFGVPCVNFICVLLRALDIFGSFIRTCAWQLLCKNQDVVQLLGRGAHGLRAGPDG